MPSQQSLLRPMAFRCSGVQPAARLTPSSLEARVYVADVVRRVRRVTPDAARNARVASVALLVEWKLLAIAGAGESKQEQV